MNSVGSLDESALRRQRLPYKWLALITASVGLLLASLNGGLVNVALPTIASEFAAPLTQVQWVLAIYPLMTVGLTLAAGYFSDVLGRKPVFILGALSFAAGSMLCAIAGNALHLIAFRAVQGIGGSIMMATSPAIITDAFLSSERGKGLGIMSTVTMLGLGIGPAIGGVIVDRVGWRWAFFAGVPVALLVVGLAFAYLVDRKPKKTKTRREFDVAGPIVLFAMAAAFLMALSEGQDNGWLSWRVWALGTVAIAGAFAIGPVERRVVMPVLDLTMVRNRRFAAASATGLIGNMVLMSLLFLVPFYLTVTAGYSASAAGILLATITVATSSVASFSGGLSDRLGSRGLCAAGTAVAALGVAGFAQLGARPDYVGVALFLAVYGIGFGLMLPPNTSAAMGAAESSRLGSASALYMTVRQLGTALGVALSGAVFSSRLAAYSGTNVVSVRGGLFDPVASAAAFRDVFWVLAIVATLGVLTSLLQPTKGWGSP